MAASAELQVAAGAKIAATAANHDEGGVHVTVQGAVGQFIAAKLLLQHSEFIIDRADSLAILLLLLIAPEMVKKFLTLKYSNGHEQTLTEKAGKK